MKHNHPKILLLPLLGILLFIILYIIAAGFYPGGSQADKASSGFSWMHNYWCNLMNVTALNGKANGARGIAILAMAVLSLSLSFFWYIFPRQAGLKNPACIVILLSGMLSMVLGMALLIGPHDMMINAAGFFGLIAFAGTLYILYRQQRSLFWLGIFNISLVVLNNGLYYSRLFYYLPVVQKITFLSVLLWIGLINLSLYRQASRSNNFETGQHNFYDPTRY